MIAAIVLASVIVVGPNELTTEQARAKFDASCAGGKTATEECHQLRSQLEVALRNELFEASLYGVEFDDETMITAARAESPVLKGWALRRFAKHGITKGAERDVIRALNDPYPRVRKAAFALVGMLGDAKYEGTLKRMVDIDTRFRADQVEPVPPDAASVSPLYPGAVYLYFASKPDEPFYRTKDSLDKVAAWYAKQGKKVVSADDLKKKKKPEMTQADGMAMAMEMQKAIAAGKDPNQVMADMQKNALAADVDWTSDFENKTQQGIGKPKYALLEERSSGGNTAAIRVAVLFEDSALGGTSIVMPLKAMKTEAAVTAATAHSKKSPTAAEYKKDMEIQSELGKQLSDPLAKQGGGDLGGDD